MKKISQTNWADWCAVNTELCANAKDYSTWAYYASCAERVFKDAKIVPDGEETHSLKVDYEHMYPYISEGPYKR